MSQTLPAAFARYQAQTHFGSLDGLRFLCILAVIWHHSPAWDPQTSALFLRRGFLGVDFFFVLSGYLITTLLLRERARKGAFSLKGFYIRRARRILPIYLFVVGLAAGWAILGKGQWHYLELVPYYLFFMANFLTDHIPLLAPTWSLAVEEQFYLVWPLLLLLLPPRAILPVLAGLIALNVVGIMGGLAPLGLEAFEAGPLTIALPNATYAPILIGAGLAVILDRSGGFDLFWRLCGARLAAPFWLAVVLVLVAILPPDLRGLPNLALHLAMALSLAALVLREDNGLAPLLRLRPFVRVGEISYGIYLYHLFGLHVASLILRRLDVADPLVVLVTYGLISVVMAEISFRTLEAWFRVKKPAPPVFSGVSQ